MKRASLAGFGIYLYAAAMPFNDGIAGGQPQTVAWGFCGKERVKKFF